MSAGDRKPAAAVPTFRLERFFDKHEFSVPDGLMCCSDPESFTLDEALALGSDATRERYARLALGYTEAQGLTALREAVVRMAGGGGATADDVLVVAPQEGIYIAMRTLLREGDEVVVLAPAYQSLYALAEAAGCRVRRWELEEAGGRWTASLDTLRGLVSPRTRLVVLNAPHNPTGFHFSREEQAEVVRVAREAGAWLFSDEMYRLLEREPANDRLPPAFSLYERAVSLGGVSKALGAPGLRIGWLCTRDAALLDQFRVQKDYLTICSPGPSEVLALALVEGYEEASARLRAHVAAGYEALRALAARVPWAFRLVEPRAGSTCFVRLELPGVTDAEFCDRLVADAGLLLLPGSLMDKPGYLRVGLGRRDFPGLCERLAAHVERQYPRGASE